MIRVLVLFKMIKREINIKLHGNIVSDVSMDRHKIQPGTVLYIIGFLTMYFLTLMISTFIISVTGQGDPLSNLTAVLTCISNVGPGLDKVGPVETFHFYSGFNKLILSLVMIAGRLELGTFFVLFSKHFWDPDRA